MSGTHFTFCAMKMFHGKNIVFYKGQMFLSLSRVTIIKCMTDKILKTI